MWKFEKEFRTENPQTIGETDRHFDLDNYKDWLEGKLESIPKEKKQDRRELDPYSQYAKWVKP